MHVNNFTGFRIHKYSNSHHAGALACETEPGSWECGGSAGRDLNHGQHIGLPLHCGTLAGLESGNKPRVNEILGSSIPGDITASALRSLSLLLLL